MKKWLTAWLVCFSSLLCVAGNDMPLEQVRQGYQNAVSDKDECLRLVEELQTHVEQPVYLAYLGGLQSIRAQHVFNPISKYNTFKDGRRNIERAVAMDPDNLEIRFVRLSIQQHLPTFLNYRQNIPEDQALLKEHIQEIDSKELRSMVHRLLN